MRGKTPPTEPLTARERRNLLVGSAIMVAVLAVGVAAWMVLDHRPNYSRSGNGCVTVQFAGTMGGSQEHACGDKAQQWCKSEYAKQDTEAERVQAQCRLAGILPSQ
ncbi:hypothetical protein [Nocardia sp. NPDC020380]|uniref:hypothetical protein n=1 Tax=Nocardia sp. NPDC020380 TaxID=3364309 RepID=UPI00379B9B05